MVVICADFFNEGFFSEYMNIPSLSFLPFFESSLISYQLKNFASLPVNKAYLQVENEDFRFSSEDCPFEIKAKTSSGILKELLAFDKNESAVIFRNDCYFEIDEKLFFSDVSEFSVSGSYPFLVLTSIGEIIKRLSTENGLSQIFLKAYEYDFRCDYFKRIRSHKSYSALVYDVLNGKTAYHPPRIAENIFTDFSLPDGDFTIIPPVFLKKGVQIESGSVIGPNAVLMEEVVIGKNTIVKNSILMKDVFVSAGCFLEGSVFGESSAIKRNSCVFNGSLVGQNAVLGEGFIAENNSLFKPYVKTDRSVKTVLSGEVSDEETVFGFRELSPEKATILGSALGTVYKNSSFGVASDGTPEALCVKLSILSGLLSVGAECREFGSYHNSRIFFDSAFCGTDNSIFISGGESGTSVSVYDKSFSSPSKADYYNILNSVKQKNFARVNRKNIKSVKQIKGLGRMYLREILVLFNSELRFNIKCETDNKFIKKTVDAVVEAVGVKKPASEEIILKFNSSGTKAYLLFSSKSYSYKKLLTAAEFMRKTMGYNLIAFDDYVMKLYRYDAISLCFFIIAAINESGFSVEEFFGKIPPLYVLSKRVKTPLKVRDLAKTLCECNGPVFKDDGVSFRKNGAKIKLEKAKGSGELKINVCSASSDIAKEVIDALETLLSST